MKLTIVGSRDLTKAQMVFVKDTIEDVIREYKEYSHPLMIISGGARGVDKLAEELAYEYKIRLIIFKPNWKKYGLKAGAVRNKKIVDEADCVLAF